MQGPRRSTKLGLFADGAVGEAVLAHIAGSCHDNLAYVVIREGSQALAESARRLGLRAPLLVWPVHQASLELPRYGSQVPDVVLLAWWPDLVRLPFLQAGQRFTLNLHPSLLPHGRGKDPNFWALVEGSPFGVTIHHVDESVDGGAIAFQREVSIDWTDTGATLYAKAQRAIISLVADSLDAILALDIPRIEQDTTIGSFHRRAELVLASLIDLDQHYTGRDLLNLLRARTFRPHSGCRFVEDGDRYEVRVEIQRIKSDE